MAEIAPSGSGGPNRLFVILAIGLGALLFLGLIGLGGFLVFQSFTRPPASPTARAVVTASPAIRVVATPAATDVATPTLVLIAASTPTGGTTPLVTATTGLTTTGTITGTPGTGTPTGSLPKTGGVGDSLLWLAGGLVLVLVIFAARRARAGTAA